MRLTPLILIFLIASCNTVSRKNPESGIKQQMVGNELGCVCVEESGSWYLYNFYDDRPQERMSDNYFNDVYTCVQEKVNSGRCFAAF